ncbi:secondary thiamine-phosphate synthase enzyme YjbQ [Luteithermobacter gelatinilyticus]|uniref:secondary thiamine-phosphate synthase enzyme YjbQ n=1 Tax=Luteithermobacter gelatinilyticus TaxID=2582913 RepID=UPI0011074308|nr:secondary thiamine-phosphate synthase enzyme YjbQ [Luteithermobacter gelatinilyticus]
MKQMTHILSVDSGGTGLYDITREVKRWVCDQGVRDGLLTLFVRHTSASLVIQENADPDVMRDLEDFFRKLVPEDNRLYRHVAEGPDDMPAHIKSALTQTQLSIPLMGGELMLGTWQGVYLFEHRARPHRRSIALHLMGT